MIREWRTVTAHVLTGFLGSGKTTLLRRLLALPELAGTAVLINEFGEVGLDHHLLEEVDEQVVGLESGGVRCSIHGAVLEHQPRGPPSRAVPRGDRCNVFLLD